MSPAFRDQENELPARQESRLLEALEMIAPGTELREGIDNIIHASTGAMLVLGDPDELSFLFSGGLKLDVEYNPAVLYQVAKMDGAIVLDPKAKRICWANVQLMPDPTIHSLETGTRHRTADRVARQTSALVIAISSRRDVVSLYLGGEKYILQDIPTVLSKANQGLATLGKYRSRLDSMIGRLTSLELEDRVSLQDVLSTLHRAELVVRTATEVERMVIELGTEGRLIEMQLEETVVGVINDRAAIIRDYATEDSDAALEDALGRLAGIPQPELIEESRLAEVLGFDTAADPHYVNVEPRGYRALSRIPSVRRLTAEKVIRHFGELRAILAAPERSLADVEGVDAAAAAAIHDGLRRLAETDFGESFVNT